MRYRTTNFYKEFHCIGGICEDSCCENWEIDLDDASLKRYKKQGGDFGQRLKDNTRMKDKQFILNGTRCPFLNADNLCDIFIEMGEDCLCETCTNFPRHIEEFEDLKEVSLTMSCPEASRIMLAKQEKMTFVCQEGTDAEYGLKHIVPPKSLFFWKKPHTNKLDKSLFEVLFVAREFLFALLQNRTFPVTERAAMVLEIGAVIQGLIEQGEYGKIESCIADYKTKDKGKWLEQLRKKYGNRLAEKELWMKQVLNMYEGLETIKEEWNVLLFDGMNIMHGNGNGKDTSDFIREYGTSYREFLHYYESKEYEFEHILVYYLFNYFLGAAYDKDAFTKVKFAILSYLVILELDVAVWLKQKKKFLYADQVLVAHAYSKEVEHSYNNFESLQLVLSAHPILDMEHMMLALLM